jgi:signal transduction histidine kinase
MAIIKVKDTGVGIEKENIPNLFIIDAGFSTKGTTEESGTGLGLIICKELVEKQKGKIWVESKKNEGSTFYFSIPVVK